jgi:hypothetical protein
MQPSIERLNDGGICRLVTVHRLGLPFANDAIWILRVQTRLEQKKTKVTKCGSRDTRGQGSKWSPLWCSMGFIRGSRPGGDASCLLRCVHRSTRTYTENARGQRQEDGRGKAFSHGSKTDQTRIRRWVEDVAQKSEGERHRGSQGEERSGIITATGRGVFADGRAAGRSIQSNRSQSGSHTASRIGAHPNELYLARQRLRICRVGATQQGFRHIMAGFTHPTNGSSARAV